MPAEIRNLPTIDLSADLQTLLEAQIDAQRRTSPAYAVQQGRVFNIGLENGGKHDRLREGLQRFISFEAGNAHLVTVNIAGKPVKFELRPVFDGGYNIELKAVATF